VEAVRLEAGRSFDALWQSGVLACFPKRWDEARFLDIRLAPVVPKRKDWPIFLLRCIYLGRRTKALIVETDGKVRWRCGQVLNLTIRFEATTLFGLGYVLRTACTSCSTKSPFPQVISSSYVFCVCFRIA